MPEPEAKTTSVMDKVHDAGDWAEQVAKGLRTGWGLKASHAYNLFTDEFKPNRAGNLRGMIRDAEARIMHGRMGLIVERLEKALVLIQFAQNLVEFEPQFEAIQRSDLPWAMKDVQYSRLVSNALVKAAATSALGDVETVVMVTRLGLHQISIAAGGGQGSKMLDSVARAAGSGDAALKQAIDSLFDPSQQDLWVQRIVEGIVR